MNKEQIENILNIKLGDRECEYLKQEHPYITSNEIQLNENKTSVLIILLNYRYSLLHKMELKIEDTYTTLAALIKRITL